MKQIQFIFLFSRVFFFYFFSLQPNDVKKDGSFFDFFFLKQHRVKETRETEREKEREAEREEREEREERNRGTKVKQQHLIQMSCTGFFFVIIEFPHSSPH